MQHAASCSHTSSRAAAAAALYCRLPLGLRSCCTLFQSGSPLPFFPLLTPTLLFFSVSGLFLPCTMSVCLPLPVCVCVCESRFCVQVRSFNFDLCFRLFCVAFVDFCHLNRNFYFPHVSRHAQTPQQHQQEDQEEQQQEEEQEQQPSPVFAFVCSFSRHCFYERMS